MASVSTAFAQIGDALQQFGVADIILPFLLIFTLLFAVFQRINLFSSGHGEGNKNIHVVLSLLISVITLVPHLSRRYPPGYDPIDIINVMIPSAAVIAVIIILFLFLAGMFGSELGAHGIPAIALILIVVAMGYVFGSTVGWWGAPNQTFGDWWNSDLSALIIIIIVFGLVLWFIVSEPKKTLLETIPEWLGKRIK